MDENYLYSCFSQAGEVMLRCRLTAACKFVIYR
jgi:hypothetical protein